MYNSNKHEPIRRPLGSIDYHREGLFGGFYAGTFSKFLDAADKLFADLAHLNGLKLEVGSVPHIEREIKAEHVTTAISAMYATVELLGIEPLVTYLAGRMEQADLDIGSYEIERHIRP